MRKFIQQPWWCLDYMTYSSDKTEEPFSPTVSPFITVNGNAGFSTACLAFTRNQKLSSELEQI